MFGLAERRNHTGPALLHPASGTSLSHAELYRRVTERAEHLAALTAGKSLVLLGLAADPAAVITYLAALEAGLAVMPLPPDLGEERLAALIGLYRPEIVVRPHLPGNWGYDTVGEGLWRRPDAAELPPLHPDLAVLLSTSGSTASPKTARLSRAAVASNAGQIVRALTIGPAERAPTTLPLSYSYGLSVLNSHLVAGAAVILTQGGLASRGFWRILAEQGATSFAGVPTSYDILRRLDLDALAPPSLKTLTQAGGALAPAILSHMHAFITRRGGRMFVMYGQTEATARMAVLPPDELPHHLGAAGRALADASLGVEDGNGTPLPPLTTGRIVYHGGNVMMGYGADRADLALGDVLGGRLETGDLGHLDAGGVLWITGRHNRLAKIDGIRINLDEVEALAADFGRNVHQGVAVTDGGDTLIITLAGVPLPDPVSRREFARRLGLHSSLIRWQTVACLPLTDRGKIDYAALGTRP